MKKALSEKIFYLTLSIVMLLYGAYLIFIYFSGKVQLLIHQDYAILTLISGIVLILFGGLGCVGLMKQKHFSPTGVHPNTKRELILVFVAIIAALVIHPAPLSTSTASVRKSGLNDDAGLSRRTTPVARFIINSENRRLIEWVNLFNQNPEPSQYEGEKVKVSGFVLKDDDLPEDYFMIARFIISCCAADARPIGIPVHYNPTEQTLENDQWIELKGSLFTTELDGESIPAIELSQYQTIPIPENPYATL